MPIFGGDCPVCAAKNEEILFLRGQVNDLQKRLIEIASPGANARIAYQPSGPREKEGAARVHSPARLGQIRATRPDPPEPGVKPTPPAVAARNLEAEFEQPS